MNYVRTIFEPLLRHIGKKPILILFGARQVGKTTLVKHIMTYFKKPLYMQGDDPKDALLLEGRSSIELSKLVSGYDLVVIDEAQRIKDIGIVLKLIADNSPGTHLIATGSSSFELANKLSEPLTGRNRKFFLYPLSLSEVVVSYSKMFVERQIEEYLIFGMYPQVVSAENRSDKAQLMKELAQDYLFRDLFLLGDIRNSFAFQKLTKLLALHVGSEVSYSQLAKEVGVSRDTIYTYVTLLEQAFIVFRLTPLYTNKIKEVNKSHKIYFYDTGIRNALIGNFDSLEFRNDKGAIFENFFIAEKIKDRVYMEKESRINFWKNRAGAEIDFVESSDTDKGMYGFECKWREKASMPAAFRAMYPHAHFETITIENIVDHFSKSK